MNSKPGKAAILFLAVLLLAGCSSMIVSHDPKTNYTYVFSAMPSPTPEIVNSRVERINRCCFLGPVNGNWEFEMYASRPWVDVLLKEFDEIEWSQITQREVPSWFTPSAADYSVWRMQATSFPNAHVFVERKPQDESRIHLFIRRH